MLSTGKWELLDSDEQMLPCLVGKVDALTCCPALLLTPLSCCLGDDRVTEAVLFKSREEDQCQEADV